MEKKPGKTIGQQQAEAGAEAFETPAAPPPPAGVDVRADLGVQTNMTHMIASNWPPTTAARPLRPEIEE